MKHGFKTVLVIGLGLIGGSIAAALQETNKGITVYGIDVDDETLAVALKKGYVAEAFHADNTVAIKKLLSGPMLDLVVLATPPDTSDYWFNLISESGYAGVLTDVASTKTPIVKSAATHLTHSEYFIPGHPMAGSEINGIQGARANLFEGAYWILAPNSQTDMYVFRRLHMLITSLGARVISVDPQEHDKAVAVVSHVPHIAASSLVALAAQRAGTDGELLRLAAGGFKDTTRIASGSPELWCGICMDNAVAISEGIRDFVDVLTQFDDLITSGDTKELTNLLAKAADVRDSLPAKWVPHSTELTRVRIFIGDQPGVIGLITGFAAKTGCNIEAIEIDHQTESRAILELILSDEGDKAAFATMLEDADFSAHFSSLESGS